VEEIPLEDEKRKKKKGKKKGKRTYYSNASRER
jgi:hypothetical protein